MQVLGTSRAVQARALLYRATMMMRTIAIVAVLWFGGCADSPTATGHTGDLCYAGNLTTNADVVTCGEGLYCPTGNPDVARYCTAAGREGDLCYAGNLFVPDAAKPCASGFYCPTGNPDVAQWCQPSK